MYFQYFLKILFCRTSFVFCCNLVVFFVCFLQKKHEISLELLHLIKPIFADIRM